jgi:hypothetical protein
MPPSSRVPVERSPINFGERAVIGAVLILVLAGTVFLGFVVGIPQCCYSNDCSTGEICPWAFAGQGVVIVGIVFESAGLAAIVAPQSARRLIAVPATGDGADLARARALHAWLAPFELSLGYSFVMFGWLFPFGNPYQCIEWCPAVFPWEGYPLLLLLVGFAFLGSGLAMTCEVLRESRQGSRSGTDPYPLR